MTTLTPTIEEIRAWLKAVKDPEIPVLSLVDLGVITEITCASNGHVRIEMTPTFAGCPAMDYMQKEVEATLAAHGLTDTEVIMSFAKPWSSDRITPEGLDALKAYGLALPGSAIAVDDLDLLEKAECPYCGSAQTVMKSMFGPTQCRSLHYCDNCKQAFERFKPL